MPAPSPENPIGTFDEDTLNEYPDPIFCVNKELTITFVNRAWFKFSSDNDGEPAISEHWSEGSRVLDAISGDYLRSFYEALFTACLNNLTPVDNPYQHEYDCSTPELVRKYSMNIYALGEDEGLLIANLKLLETPIDDSLRVAVPEEELEKIQAAFTIQQCGACRNTKSASQPDKWYWISELVAHPPGNIKYTLCNLCIDQYAHARLSH